MPRFSVARPSKIYPNWDFWFENKPSGNPVRNSKYKKTQKRGYKKMFDRKLQKNVRQNAKTFLPKNVDKNGSIPM
jgi:hypothetical protein